MIDEAQDWPEDERDILYKLYGHRRVILADGVDQFVRSDKQTNWREGIDLSETQVVPLYKSLRLKREICMAVTHFASEIEFGDWDLQPVPDAHGGRVIIVIGKALSREFHEDLFNRVRQDGNRNIDMLFCVPPKWVKDNEEGGKYSLVAERFEKWGYHTWDGVDDAVRREFPTSLDQMRIVQYDSCRGLEGWAVVNYAMDVFFDYKRDSYKAGDAEKRDLFFEDEKSDRALDYAKKWMMIPLTRAVDTLVIHVNTLDSWVGRVLISLRDDYPDDVEWVEGD